MEKNPDSVESLRMDLPMDLWKIVVPKSTNYLVLNQLRLALKRKSRERVISKEKYSLYSGYTMM